MRNLLHGGSPASLARKPTSGLALGCVLCNQWLMTKPSPLRAYREGSKQSLEQIAALFGVNKTTVMRWEERVPAERALDIERATGVPRWELRPDLWDAPANERAA